MIAVNAARAFLGLNKRQQPGAGRRGTVHTFRADSSDPAAFAAAVRAMNQRS